MHFNILKRKVMHVGSANTRSDHEYTMRGPDALARILSTTCVERLGRQQDGSLAAEQLVIAEVGPEAVELEDPPGAAHAGL